MSEAIPVLPLNLRGGQLTGMAFIRWSVLSYIYTHAPPPFYTIYNKPPFFLIIYIHIGRGVWYALSLYSIHPFGYALFRSLDPPCFSGQVRLLSGQTR